LAGNLRDAIDKFPIARWLEGQAKTRDGGTANLVMDCPVCGGRRKLWVHRERKHGQCFKCAEGGAGGAVWDGKAGLIKLIELIERCDKRQAIDRIFELSGVPDYGYTPREIPEAVLPKGRIPLQEVHPLQPGRKMLADRGCEHLVGASYAVVEGRFRYRVIMPIQWFGELLGFDAKAWLPAMKPKSLFPEWQEGGAIHTTAAWDHSEDFCVITESVLDAETLGVNAVGILGAVLRDAQLSRLLDLRGQGVRRLVWMLDGDAFTKAANAILRKTGRFENYVAVLTRDEDPNDLGRQECWNRVKTAVPVRDEFDLVKLQFSRPC